MKKVLVSLLMALLVVPSIAQTDKDHDFKMAWTQKDAYLHPKRYLLELQKPFTSTSYHHSFFLKR